MTKTTTVEHGTKAIIDGRRCYFGTVEGYAAQYGEDAGQAIARAIRNRHELQWINLTCSVLVGGAGHKGFYERDRAEWADALVLSVGDSVVLASGVFTIVPAPNRNFALKAVERVIYCDRCGSPKPAQSSCDCFDNGCQ